MRNTENQRNTVPTLLTFLKIIYKLLQYSGLESSINLQWWAPNQDSGWETRLWLGGCAKHKGVAMKRCISYWYWYVNPLRTHYQVRVCPNRWLDQTRTKVQMPEGELNCSEKSIEHSRNWSLAIHDHPNMLGKSTISRLCHFRNAAIKGLVDTLGAVFYTWSLSRSTCGFGVS